MDTFDAMTNALLLEDAANPNPSLRVQNPLHCLIGKTAALAQLPQVGRQDEKHLKLSILIVRAFITERLAEARSVLKMIERIFALARSDLGLRVWHRHNIEIEKSLPLEVMTDQPDERLQEFGEIRLPQLLKQLKESRERYPASFSES